MTMQEYAPDPPSKAKGAVVGKRPAPSLFVVYTCTPDCDTPTQVLDAYAGVPSCTAHPSPMFLRPVRLATIDDRMRAATGAMI